MGYPEMMRDIMEQGKREELEKHTIIDDVSGLYNEKCRDLRLDEEMKEKMENVTVHAGIAQCDYHDQAEELIEPSNDALLKDKQESEGKWKN